MVQPLYVILPPGVYVTPTGLPVPVPVTLKVVAEVKVMVTGCCKLALASGASVRIGAAAASRVTSLIARLMPDAPFAVGLMMYSSPAAKAPDVIDRFTPSIGPAGNAAFE